MSSSDSHHNIKSVRLKNGVESRSSLVSIIMTTLRLLHEEEPQAFYTFVTLCRNPKQQLSHEAYKELEEIGVELLLEYDGHPHSAVCSIVLAAVVGDGADMQLQWPIAEQED